MIEQGREALKFLEAVFGTKPDDAYVVVGRIEPKVEMQSFLDLSEAAAYVAGKDNMYVHVGVTRRCFQGNRRPSAADIDGLAALVADVDVAGAAHTKDRLPPDYERAMAVVRSMGLPPTVVVDSGHGLQAWWAFREIEMFADDRHRRSARVLARAWAITLRERARALGYQIDMVGDIARLMRIPGTVNTKLPEAPEQARIFA